MGFEQDDNFDLPAARKGQSGGPGGNPPLRPDHGASGPFTVGGYNQGGMQSEPWNQGAGGFDPPSTPYGAPVAGYVPPPPPGGGRPKSTNGGNNNRRRGVALLTGALLTLLVIGTSSYFLFFKDSGISATNTPGPVAIATNTVPPTATLKPGQTPLPTKVPTATAQPTAPPGQPTFTPVPTSTPIPYASSAVVKFTDASANIPSISSTLTAAVSGGQIAAQQESASVAVGNTASSNSSAAYYPGSHVTVSLTVTNNSPQPQLSSGYIIPSGTSGVDCTLQGDITVQPGKTHSVVQQCFEPIGPEPQVSYNYTTTNGTDLNFVGTGTASGTSPYYYVPTDCNTDNEQTTGGTGNLTAAKNAATAAINSQLSTQANGGTPFFGPNDTLNADSTAVCTPASNTQQANAFNYTVSIGGQGNETTYNPSNAISYQHGALQNATNGITPSGSWIVIHSSVCSSPSVSNATATSATISCPASGVAGWNWNGTGINSTLTIANLINGEPYSVAISDVNLVQGVKSGSAKITLTGGSYLPQNVGNISFNIITP